MATEDELPRSPLGELLGIRYAELSAERVVIECEVTPRLMQPFGLVHGGTYCAIVEEAASIGGLLTLAARGEGGLVVGVHNATDFLRAVSTGTLRAEATALHRGRSQQLWEVRISGSDGRLAARGQVRLQHVAGPAARASGPS